MVSLYFNTLFNWYINLTIDGTIYPSQYFPFGAAFYVRPETDGSYYICKRSFIMSDFNWKSVLLDTFPTNSQTSNVVKNSSSGSRVAPCGRIDGRAGRQSLVFALRSFVNMPKIWVRFLPFSPCRLRWAYLVSLPLHSSVLRLFTTIATVYTAHSCN